MQKILNTAKETAYKHKDWFKEGRSVYDAVSYFVDSGMFTLDTTVKYMNQLPEYKGKNLKSDIVEYLIEKEDWKHLVIRYEGKEKGTDRGKLKILTFIYLQKLKHSEHITRLNREMAEDLMKTGANDVMRFVKDKSAMPIFAYQAENISKILRGESAPEAELFVTYSSSKWIENIALKADGDALSVRILFRNRYEEKLDWFASHWIDLRIVNGKSFGSYTEQQIRGNDTHLYQEFDDRLASTFFDELPGWFSGKTTS